jgi:hypothetical protein
MRGIAPEYGAPVSKSANPLSLLTGTTIAINRKDGLGSLVLPSCSSPPPPLSARSRLLSIKYGMPRRGQVASGRLSEASFFLSAWYLPAHFCCWSRFYSPLP